MTKADKFTLAEIDFCKLFNESIRSRIVTRLLKYEELKITDFNLDDSRLKGYVNEKISRNAINNHLSKLRKDGFANYRKDGLYVYWSINRDNILLNRFRILLQDIENKTKKEWSKNTSLDVHKYLSEFYHIHDVFKPSEFRTRLEQKSYIISSARLSQILKGLTQSGHLKKEERARYKIMKVFTEEESL